MGDFKGQSMHWRVAKYDPVLRRALTSINFVHFLGFKWKHALTAHSVIHAPEKKFLCQECGFSTSHMSTFKIHNRMHSGNLMKCDVKNCTFQVLI